MIKSIQIDPLQVELSPFIRCIQVFFTAKGVTGPDITKVIFMSVVLEIPGCAMGACSACGMCGVADPNAVTGGPYDPSRQDPAVAAVISENNTATFYTSGRIGTPVVVTYAFSGAEGADFDANSWLRGLKSEWGITDKWMEFTEGQIEAIDRAADTFSQASGLKLVRVSDPSQASIVWHYGEISKVEGMSAAFAPADQPIGSDVIINSRYMAWFETLDFSPGGRGFASLLHEFGHAVALKHPFFGQYQLAPTIENRASTVMSHTEAPDGSYASDLKPLDKLALRVLYGDSSATDTPANYDPPSAPRDPILLIERDGTAGCFSVGGHDVLAFQKSSDVQTIRLTATGVEVVTDQGDTINLGDASRIDLLDGTVFLNTDSNVSQLRYTAEALTGQDALWSRWLETLPVGDTNSLLQGLRALRQDSRFISEFNNHFSGVDDIRFVEAIARSLLDRPLSALETFEATSRLKSGISRSEFALEVASSEAYRARIATSPGLMTWITDSGERALLDIYSFAFNRVPVDTPLANISGYLKSLDTGESPTSIANSLVGSAEFWTIRDTSMTDEMFVQTVFAYGFDRQPTESDVVQGVLALRSGLSRGELISSYVASAENIGKYGSHTADGRGASWENLGAGSAPKLTLPDLRLDGSEIVSFTVYNAEVSTARVAAGIYSGPVSYIQYYWIGEMGLDVIRGSRHNDFINASGGTDAVDAGSGNDVVDGGTGSNFITGGEGQDVFFVDGRSGEVTWSTITDWQSGEDLVIWGYRPGVSQIEWEADQGAPGYKGLTLHIDLDGNSTTDISVTWSFIGEKETLPRPDELDGLLWFH